MFSHVTGFDTGVTANIPAGPNIGLVHPETTAAYAEDAADSGRRPSPSDADPDNSSASDQGPPVLQWTFLDPLPAGAAVDVPPIAHEFERRRRHTAAVAAQDYRNNISRYNARYTEAKMICASMYPGKFK